MLCNRTTDYTSSTDTTALFLLRSIVISQINIPAVSMPVPDRRLVITEDHIPNLRNLLMLSREGGVHNLIEEAKQILMEKLRRNLSAVA
jgi:hypothetical protein